MKRKGPGVVKHWDFCDTILLLSRMDALGLNILAYFSFSLMNCESSSPRSPFASTLP